MTRMLERFPRKRPKLRNLHTNSTSTKKLNETAKVINRESLLMDKMTGTSVACFYN